MQTFLENAEEEGSMATTPETGAFHAEEKAPSCLTDGTGTLYYTVYHQVPETSLYVEESVAVYTFPISAQGHFCTNWNVTVAPTEGSTGTAQSVCTTCGNTISVTLPKFTESNVVTEETELAEGYYFKETKQELTCEQDGIVDYQYMFTSSDLTNAKVSTSDSTENTVSFTVTTPATGHDYPETATWQENKFVVNCNNNCGKNYTLTITFAPGDGGTGSAPDMSSMTVSFDKEAMTFSFTTPASCPFTAPESKFFDGWSVGENTYGNSAPVTVPATAGAGITLTAQWTTEHTHQYGAPTFDYLTGKVLRQCTLCSSGEGRTLSYDIDSLEVDSATKPASFVVTDTDVDAVLTDLPDTVRVLARGDWESEDTTDVVIPHEYLKATITDNAYKNSTISIALNVTDPTSETAATITGVTLLTQKLPSGSVNVNTYSDKAQAIGTFTGEFEIHYTLSGIQRNTQNDQTEGSPNMWNSWLLTFVSNGKDAVLREDNFMLGNFGRGDGFLNTATGTTATDGMQATLQAVDELSFVVTRTYDTDAGVYELTIVISGGEKDITVTITEPDTLGNVMTVYLAGEDTAYDYSAVNAADEQIAMTGIEADNVSVAYGTELNNVSLPVYGVYGSRAVKDLIASVYTLTCDGYSATTPDTYTVTVKYGEFEDTVSLTVLEENWIAVNKTIENPTAWATWYDLPVSLAFGQVISIEGSQAGANPTLKDGENIINWHTVLWQTNNGKFSGRLDNFGWTFGSTESPSAVTAGSGNTLALKNASGEAQALDWEKVHYLMQNSDFTFTYDWTTEGVLKLTIEVTATSGDYEGWVYTNEYYMNVNADSLTNGVIDIHLTGDHITSFTVDSYLVRDSQ